MCLLPPCAHSLWGCGLPPASGYRERGGGYRAAGRRQDLGVGRRLRWGPRRGVRGGPRGLRHVLIGASLAVLASQNTLYAVRLALRFRVWLGTASAWLRRVSLLFFSSGVGAKSVLSIIPSSPRISTSFCHTWGTRKVQPKLPYPNCAPGTARDPCPCPDSADGPRPLQHPGRHVDARGAS